MSVSRMLKVLAKDVRLGPRSGVLIMALLMPVLLTLIIQVVFGSLFDPDPRLGVVDLGDSQLTAAMQEIDGIQVVLLNDVDEMKTQVEANNLDGGIFLPEGFDDAVRAGLKPELGFWLGGESLASSRLVIGVTIIDLVREVEGTDAPVEVVENIIGQQEAIPLAHRLTSIIMFYALIIGSLFQPAFGLVEEREYGTLSAMLVTPVKLVEVIMAKGIFGIVLGAILVVVTLALNGALPSLSLGLVLTILVGALMCMLIGLIYAMLSKDAQQLYMLVKGFGIMLFAPVLWHIFPGWPQWIARIFPTYWFINPLYEITVLAKGFTDIWIEVLVGGGICLILAVIVALLSRRMRFKIAAG